MAHITRNCLGYKGRCPKTCAFCANLDMCEEVTDTDDPKAICDEWEEEMPLWEEGYGAASIDQGERLGIDPELYR